MKSRYSLTNINQQYYCSVDLANGLSDESNTTILKVNESGVVFLPYIIVTSTPKTSGIWFRSYLIQNRKDKINKIKKNKR